MDHSGSLQEIVADVTADNLTFAVKMNLDELSKSRGIIVSSGFGISKSLKNWISVENFCLKGSCCLTKVAAQIVENVLLKKWETFLISHNIS